MFAGAFWRGIIGLFITGYFAVSVSSRLTNPNLGLDMGAPVGYLDPYPRVFSRQNSYPHL